MGGAAAMDQGFLNLHKPSGLTSRKAIDPIQRLARRAKVGHAGTLDPLASGVLVVGVGGATRLIEYVRPMPKRYRGRFLLGRRSTTEDVEGEVTRLDDPPIPTLEQLVRAAQSFTGPIEQRPPAFSALKVQGQRAYALARQGREVRLAPRPIAVYRLEVVAYDYPELQLEIECSSGTYVRSLGRDLAESLGTAAVMSGLVRTAVGPFRIEEATPPDALDRESWTEHLLPLCRAVEGLPRAELSAAEIARIGAGQTISRRLAAPSPGEVAAFDPAGRLAAILVARGPDCWGPKINLPASKPAPETQ